MENKKFICGNKYTISGTNTIALSVEIFNLPARINVENSDLVSKSTFHISLVCINEIIHKNKITDTNFKDSVVADFCNFVQENDVDLIKYTNEFRFVEQNDQKSIVAFCEVSNINKFFDILNEKYNLNLECPPMHVTIYLLEGKLGIFLTDTNDLNDFTKIIPNPIGINL
jgi:hypothetical protein